MTLDRVAVILSLTAILVAPGCLGAEVRLADIADTSLQAYEHEVDLNSGASSVIRIKGWQHFMLVKFEMPPELKTWRVERARLYLHVAGPSNMLWRVGLSTITADWDEGGGRSQKVAGGCTFLRASAPNRYWAGPGSDFTDVAFGNGGSFMAYAIPKDLPGGWLQIDVDPRLVEACAAGASYGLCISDEKGQTFFNNDVHSREQSGFAPYLVVDGAPGKPHPRPAPQPAPPVRKETHPRPIQAVQIPKRPGGVTGTTVPPTRAYPGEVKIDPVSGETMEGVQAHGVIRLDACANEVFSFQVAIGGAHRGVTVSLSDLKSLDGAVIPSTVARWYREWCVKDGGHWWGEYAVPIAGPFHTPWAKNAIPGQRWQPVLCDIYVPKSARPGQYTGQFKVIAGGDTATTPVVIRVHDFVMPDQTNFEVDFNCYGPVGDTREWKNYLAREHEYYSACQNLRATLNPLPYSQSGSVYPGFAPEVKGGGSDVKLVDWTRYDQHYGPYLDGSAFTGYRAGVPITHLYLPLNENWPSPIAEHYHVHITEKRYPQMIVQHARLAGPIATCFDEAYKAAFVSAARQFAEHFRERGWTHTVAQCYMNDKHFYRDPKLGGRGTSWWCLDEPMCTDDFLAVRFFGKLFHEGVDGIPGVHMIFRGDISRPQWQRHFLDGITGLECVAGALWPYHDRLMDMQRRWGVRFWDYGSPNPVGASNLTEVRWALRSYLAGADGVLPWNVIGGDGAYTKPTDTALLVPGDRFGIKGPIVSLRAKAFRRGEEDVELLIGLAKKRGWDRTQLAEALGSLLPAWSSDAWGKVSAADLDRLRLSLYNALD